MQSLIQSHTFMERRESPVTKLTGYGMYIAINFLSRQEPRSLPLFVQ